MHVTELHELIPLREEAKKPSLVAAYLRGGLLLIGSPEEALVAAEVLGEGGAGSGTRAPEVEDGPVPEVLLAPAARGLYCCCFCCCCRCCRCWGEPGEEEGEEPAGGCP
jgi:hypothetical protein